MSNLHVWASFAQTFAKNYIFGCSCLKLGHAPLPKLVSTDRQLGVASSEGHRTEHKPLSSTRFELTDCVCRRVRQWVMTVMARSSGTKS